MGYEKQCNFLFSQRQPYVFFSIRKNRTSEWDQEENEIRQLIHEFYIRRYSRFSHATYTWWHIKWNDDIHERRLSEKNVKEEIN